MSGRVGLRYLVATFKDGVLPTLQDYYKGAATEASVVAGIQQWLTLKHKLTFTMPAPADDSMAPTCTGKDRLLVRSIPRPSTRNVFVGDCVALKSPLKDGEHMVRRVVAIEGDEMVSSEESQEPFQLDRDLCWVLADNPARSPAEATDSRTFGPLQLSRILGRAIYCARSVTDHSHIENSERAAAADSAVLTAELDVEDLVKEDV
eukprot:jgi/Chlat1/6818/Chrsp51S06503